MKPAYKIPLITAGIIIFCCLISYLTTGAIDLFLWAYAIFSVPVGALFALGALGAFFINKKDRQIAYGFLLTGALLMLTGFFLWSSVSFGR